MNQMLSNPIERLLFRRFGNCHIYVKCNGRIGNGECSQMYELDRHINSATEEMGWVLPVVDNSEDDYSVGVPESNHNHNHNHL